MIESLARRGSPYWNILEYCRHVGVEKRPGEEANFWLARIRMKDGKYKQKRLCTLPATFAHETYPKAIELARAWFLRPDIQEVASQAYAVGNTLKLKYKNKGGVFTVGDALVDYVEWKRLVASYTHLSVSISRINHHILPVLGDIPADELNGGHVRQFMERVLQMPPKRGNRELGAAVQVASLSEEELRKRKKTLNATLAELRGCLRQGWENGTVENDRAWRCIHNVPNYDAPRTIALTRNECRTLISCCRPDLRQLVLGALYTGCRVSELVRLKVRDVAPSVYGIYIGRSKSYRGRYVYLPDEGYSFFLKQVLEREESDFVFRHRDSAPWQNGTHRHLFKDTVRMANLPDEVCFHSLRHTYASQLVQAGTPLIYVARQLGHATVDTVVRTYGHLAPSSQEAEIRSRFASIDHEESEYALVHARELGQVRASLQDTHHGSAVKEAHQESAGSTLSRRAWPRSNFFKGVPIV